MTRVIFHVDMDAFYVAAERLRDETLRGQPVIIGADPKEGRGRGVVAACSYEAREKGVRSGMPISTAYRKCPEATFLRPDFSYYGQVSDEVMRVLETQAALVEQVSIDEAYLDVTDRAGSFAGAEAMAHQVKAEVLERTGLTCSIGVAPNKSIAKIASDMEKPDGLTIVPPEGVADFLGPLPVAKIPGVGTKSEAVLKEMGIETIGELAERSPREITQVFGKGGVWLWAVARGEEEVPVEARGEPRSFSAEHTFEVNTDDWDRIHQSLKALVDDVFWRVRDDGYLFRTVGIKIRFQDFQTLTRDRTLSAPANDRDTMESVAKELLREFHGAPKKIRLIGVRVASLKKVEAEQQTLGTWTG